MSDVSSEFLAQATAVFQRQKALGERALSQVDDAQLFSTLDAESNSIAVIVKHLHGNMRSRWTDFLTSDGEKPDRNRDDEFVAPAERTRGQVLTWWEDGWRYVLSAIGALKPEQVTSLVHIRGESMSAMAATMRQMDHYGQHVGQIILLAKHLRGPAWQTLSIPRGKSAEFNRQVMPPL
jgi:hypothetical protein